MTNDELKMKIVDILKEAMKPIEYGGDFEHAPEVHYPTEEEIADALTATGIGDVKRHRVFVSKDGKEVKQFYSGEEVENIVKERNELKVELRDKADYIHEQDEVIKEFKHRAEIAERALQYACKSILKDRNDTERRVRAYFNAYLERAEKELAEEGKE